MKRYAEAADVKVGALGYGGAFNMGKQHLDQMRDAGMTPLAACDLDEERLAAAEADFPGIETYTSLERMLDESDVDLLAVITPHNTHAELALKCLQSGRHVVVEKPMAVTTDECDRMIAAAEASNVLLSTYHNRHWDGCVLRAVEQVVREGIIGEVYRIEAHMGGYRRPGDWWRSSRAISGGILYDWGVHLLEYSLQLLPGAQLTEVSGYRHTGYWSQRTGWGEEANEDEARAVARFDTGQWLTLTMSALDSYPKGRERKWVEVTATRGSYLFDGGSWRTVLQSDEGALEEEGANPHGEDHRYYANVAAALLGEEELIVTAEWARRPIHVLDLAVRSAEEGRALPATYG